MLPTSRAMRSRWLRRCARRRLCLGTVDPPRRSADRSPGPSTARESPEPSSGRTGAARAPTTALRWSMRFLMRLHAGWPTGWSGRGTKNFVVLGTKALANGDILVRSEFRRPVHRPTSVDWRVRHCGGRLCIGDVLCRRGLRDRAAARPRCPAARRQRRVDPRSGRRSQERPGMTSRSSPCPPSSN